MRRRIAILLSITLLISMGLTSIGTKQVLAAGNTEQVINAIGVMDTDKGSNLEGTTIVTRSRFAQMLVNISTIKDTVSAVSNVSPFSDVKKKHWAVGYIQTAISQGWMSGYLNGSFKPERGVTLQEAVYGVIKLLGYTNSDFSGNLSGGIMTLYKTKDLDHNINKTKKNYLTVDDCFNLFYNTLNTTTKDGKVYATTIGYTLDSNGKVDYVSLVNTGVSGPVIADSNWESDIPFSLDGATYYKGGEKCKYTDLEEYDVLYYSESLKTIWSYDDKVTGSIQSINPDYTTPKSVSISGKVYNLADSNVSMSFSSMGNVKKGDYVTLLLGKEGAVVDVLSLDEYNTTITGVVLETGTHVIEDKDGEFVSTDYVTFVDAAGNEYQQDHDSYLDFVAEDLIRVTYKDGEATVSKYILTSSSFGSNTFNSNGTALGDYKLASNVKILDLRDDQFIRVNSKRLSGVTIYEPVYYVEFNGNEISQLILKDVTGDMDEYGIFTGFGSGTGMTAYSYLIGDKAASLATNAYAEYSFDIGPIGLVFDGTTLSSTYALKEVKVSSIGKTSVQNGNTKYSLADEYHVYILQDDKYVSTTLSKIEDLSKYEVKAYYDSLISWGGRIRVIVAESIN